MAFPPLVPRLPLLEAQVSVAGLGPLPLAHDLGACVDVGGTFVANPGIPHRVVVELDEQRSRGDELLSGRGSSPPRLPEHAVVLDDTRGYHPGCWDHTQHYGPSDSCGAMANH